MNQSTRNFLKGFLSVTLVMTMSLTTPISHFSVYAEEERTQLAENMNAVLLNSLTDLSENVDTDVKLVDENKDKREQNVKHFIREDGLVEATYYAHSVHYEKEAIW